VNEHARHASTGGTRPGDRLLQVGCVLFALGVLAVAVVVGGWFLQTRPADAFAVLTALAPLGLGLALVGLLRGIRADRRRSS